MNLIDKIQDRVRKATRGKWHWWTSNSWRRLMTRFEDQRLETVLRPFNNQADDHIDVSINQADMTLIENAPADLKYLLRLVAEYENGLTASGCGNLIVAARERAENESH